jgi:hypothetical protein
VIVNQGHLYAFKQKGSFVELNFEEEHLEQTTIQLLTSEGNVVFEETFETIKAGTTNEFHFYQYSDYEVNVAEAAYYRLRQFDFNGQENLSQIIQSEVLVNQGHKYKFVQNGSRIALNFLDRHDESATIQVVTAEGRIVFDKTFDIVHKEQSVEIDLSEYSSGWYVLGIIGADNAHFEKMILLNAAK